MQTRHTAPSATSQSRMSADNGEMRDQIVNWLKDAYAMERGLMTALEKQKNNDDLGPAVRDRAAKHLEETRRHAQEVQTALKSMDADTSGLKTGMGVAIQATKGMTTRFARDEQVKDLLDAYAMEHFEIACYTALAAAAEHAGFSEVAHICNRIIKDEEQMASAIKAALPTEVVSYLFETARA